MDKYEEIQSKTADELADESEKHGSHCQKPQLDLRAGGGWEEITCPVLGG